jgi:hypothetical protein
MSNADVFGVGRLGPVIDLGAGECREPVQLLRNGHCAELQFGVHAR